jgi:peptidoglycan hydrolase-like protein with peptidoglycan-binding domain
MRPTSSSLAAKGFHFPRTLGPGDEGKDVKLLQIRVAGWFPSRKQVPFKIDGVYGRQTAVAIRAFRRKHGLPASRRANEKVLELFEGLQDPDGSTAHFDWEEFMQNTSASCSAEANENAGSFRGGMVRKRIVRRNVRWMMWRLEAIRNKVGNKAIGINSGFRSVAYNKCIGGASASQHMYGAAVDIRISGFDNQAAREVAKGSQVYGIGCYAELTHKHFDLRIENNGVTGLQTWWWPEKDKKGRDLDEAGKRCWGQDGTKVDSSSPRESQIVVAGVVLGLNGTGSTEPSEGELTAWEAAGESGDYEGRD